MSVHTPGPWTYRQSPESAAGDWQVTARISDNAVMRVGVHNEANARLIAASPELLEALRHAADWFNAMQVSVPASQHVKAAIAKATGEKA